nr:MAG TPA: hypothetical protein [Bacteriophage sp.]
MPCYRPYKTHASSQWFSEVRFLRLLFQWDRVATERRDDSRFPTDSTIIVASACRSTHI